MFSICTKLYLFTELFLIYTYEQVLASQAEQVDSKANNTDNLPEIGKLLIKDGLFNKNKDSEKKFKVI